MTIRDTLAIALIAVASVSLSRPAEAIPLPAWEIAEPENFRNDSWSFGEIFTVGDSNVVVTAIGAFDADLDGFVSNSIPVGIYRESDDALLSSTSVTSSSSLIGHYRYQDIAPLILLANTRYRAVAVNLDDLYNLTPPTTVNPLINWDGYGYCQTTTLTSCDDFTGSQFTWMGNFLVDSSVPTTVPEPASIILIGSGLVGAGLRRYRGRRA